MTPKMVFGITNLHNPVNQIMYLNVAISKNLSNILHTNEAQNCANSAFKSLNSVLRVNKSTPPKVKKQLLGPLMTFRVIF